MSTTTTSIFAPVANFVAVEEPKKKKKPVYKRCYKITRRCGKKMWKFTVVKDWIAPVLLSVLKAVAFYYVFTVIAMRYTESVTHSGVTRNVAVTHMQNSFETDCWKGGARTTRPWISRLMECEDFIVAEDRLYVVYHTEKYKVCDDLISFCANYGSRPDLYIAKYVSERENENSWFTYFMKKCSDLVKHLVDYNVLGYLFGRNQDWVVEKAGFFFIALVGVLIAIRDYIARMCYCLCCCGCLRDSRDGVDGGEGAAEGAKKNPAESAKKPDPQPDPQPDPVPSPKKYKKTGDSDSDSSDDDDDE